MVDAGRPDEDLCVICQDGFKDDPDVQHLGCTHKFHAYCIQMYMQVSGCRALEELACPQCKLDGHDLSARAETLLSNNDDLIECQSSGEEGEEPPADPAPADDEEMGDAGDKGKGKGTGKGKGKAKAKGRGRGGKGKHKGKKGKGKRTRQWPY